MTDRMTLDASGKPLFVSSAISMGANGKPVFLGKDEEKVNKPRGESSKMMCPQCQKEFDYLLGDTDTLTGEMQGCEGCYRPPKIPKKGGTQYDGQQTKEISFD